MTQASFDATTALKVATAAHESTQYADETRYDRQNMLLGYENSSILHEKKVAIIGVGGLGGLCSLLLSNAGVGELTLADNDVVSLSNLHRQILYTEDNIGSAKVFDAQKMLQERNSNTSIRALNERIDAHNFASFASGADLVLDLTDNAQSRLHISKICLEHKINLLSAAVSAYSAIFSIFRYADDNFVKQYGCYRCLTNGAAINTKVGITGPIAANAASMASHITLEFLLGRCDFVGKLLRMDFRNYRMQTMQLGRDPHCCDCEQY